MNTSIASFLFSSLIIPKLHISCRYDKLTEDKIEAKGQKAEFEKLSVHFLRSLLIRLQVSSGSKNITITRLRSFIFFYFYFV